MGKTKTKTWKIGEYCKGGIITVEITGNEVAVIGKDWDTSAGWNKGSNQSKAKEFDRETVSLDDNDAHRKLSNFLNDLTTHYYSEQVLEWIEANSTFKKKMFW